MTLKLLQAITYLQAPHAGLTVDQLKIQTTDDEFDVVLVDKGGKISPMEIAANDFHHGLET